MVLQLENNMTLEVKIFPLKNDNELCEMIFKYNNELIYNTEILKKTDEELYPKNRNGFVFQIKNKDLFFKSLIHVLSIYSKLNNVKNFSIPENFIYKSLDNNFSFSFNINVYQEIILNFDFDLFNIGTTNEHENGILSLTCITSIEKFKTFLEKILS